MAFRCIPPRELCLYNPLQRHFENAVCLTQKCLVLSTSSRNILLHNISLSRPAKICLQPRASHPTETSSPMPTAPLTVHDDHPSPPPSFPNPNMPPLLLSRIQRRIPHPLNPLPLNLIRRPTIPSLRRIPALLARAGPIFSRHRLLRATALDVRAAVGGARGLYACFRGRVAAGAGFGVVRPRGVGLCGVVPDCGGCWGLGRVSQKVSKCGVGVNDCSVMDRDCGGRSYLMPGLGLAGVSRGARVGGGCGGCWTF